MSEAGEDGTRLVASIWDCGDEYCNCSGFRIERLTPQRTRAGFPITTREIVWSGGFRTDGESQTTDEWREFLAECARRGVQPPDPPLYMKWALEDEKGREIISPPASLSEEIQQ